MKYNKIKSIGFLICLISMVLMNEPRTSPHFTIGYIVFWVGVVLALVGIILPLNKKKQVNILHQIRKRSDLC